jgi:phasin family protein
MSKAKTAGEKATASAETVLENGAAALKTGLEKALKGYDAFVGYGKRTADAVTKSATVAGKGIESINSEIYSYSKQSIEDAVAATKAVMGSKSVHEAFEFQTDFAKSAFEAYVAELSKISELGHRHHQGNLRALQGPRAGLAGHGSVRPRPKFIHIRIAKGLRRSSPGPFCFWLASLCLVAASFAGAATQALTAS